MADAEDCKDQIERLAMENARLRGEILATGIILAQLLQSICKTQLNPTAFANKIMKEAHDAVAAFEPEGETQHRTAAKASALVTVKHYDEQIRSVLPI
jgi:hypothetical protein